MVPPHSVVIGPDDLAADFDAATIARGVRYANEGRVRDAAWSSDGRTLTGSCVGSGNRVYRTNVTFERFGVEPTLAWAACSCPVGTHCKHAVALLLTAAASGPRIASPDRWRTVLTSVLDEMAAPAADIGYPIGLEFSLAPPNRYRPRDTTALRPVTIGKRGTWVKRGLNWHRVIYNPDRGEFNGGQFLAIRALATELQRSYPVIVGDALMLGGAPPALWARLTDAVDAGVTMVADGSSGLQTVEFAKNAQLRLDFAAEDSGGATMSVVLIVDGEECDPHGMGLIGLPTPHGMQQVVDGVLRVGPFDPTPGRTMLDLIARDERVHIPADMADEFSLNILPRLTDVVPVELEEGLFTPPTVSGPVPVLTISPTGTGARAYWSTRYEVNDKHHQFDPNAPTLKNGYRDVAAEELAWERVIPALRTVAAASSSFKRQAAHRVKQTMDRIMNTAVIGDLRAIEESPNAAGAAAVASIATLRSSIDLTMAEAAVLCVEVLPQLDCLDAFTIEIDEGAPDFRAGGDPQLEFSSGDGELVHNDWFDLNAVVDPAASAEPARRPGRRVKDRRRIGKDSTSWSSGCPSWWRRVIARWFSASSPDSSVSCGRTWTRSG
jgi:hypothetical protein